MTSKTEDYRQDWQDIRQRRKPLAVFERSGCAETWHTLQLAQDSGQYPALLFWQHRLTDDTGQRTDALAVSLELGTLRQYQVLLERQQDIPRAVFQSKLGKLFGYSAEDIADFVGSELSQSCKCTLCGRDDIAAAAAARRTQYHA